VVCIAAGIQVDSNNKEDSQDQVPAVGAVEQREISSDFAQDKKREKHRRKNEDGDLYRFMQAKKVKWL
jgi:hypothetical protein